MPREENRESPFDDLRQIVAAARPAMSAMPADCTNHCQHAECNCSGQYRVVAWAIDVPKLRELLGE